MEGGLPLRPLTGAPDGDDASWWRRRPRRRTVLGALAFLAALAAGLTARVLWVRRAVVAETAQQLPRSLETTRPALDLWRAAYAGQAALLARVAAVDSSALPAVLGALAPASAGDGVTGALVHDAVAAPRVVAARDARGTYADFLAPVAPGRGAVRLRVRVTDSTFAVLNPARASSRGGRTSLVARLAGDSLLVVATASGGGDPAPRRALALADVPAHVRLALDGRATNGAARGLYAPHVVYAAAPVAALGWAIVREQRVDALHALIRVPLVIEESIFATIAILLALTIVGIVRASRARRASSIAQLRADFVSAVSHELRTPLAQIRLFAELLRNDKLRDAAEADRALGVIEKESGRLSILVDNILSYTSLRRRQRFVTPLAADVSAEARQVIESFAPLAAERGARVVADLEEGTRARIDAQALRQVLLNFLENAVKYGPKGQTVTVGARHAIDGHGGTRVRLWVDDEGPGVAADERPAVWRAFYRTDRARRSGVGGSGLGLAVVHDLVAQYGGSAAVEDAPNGGARFVVELPGLRVA